MSEKGKRTETRGYKKCLPAMLKALKKGMRVEELSDTEHCGHDNLYSLIGIFHKAELIFEKSGKWYYTWEEEKEKLIQQHQKEIEQYQTYKTPEERQEKLQLSEKLMKEVLDSEIPFPVLREDSPYLPYFLQHLESGYPVLFKYWEELEELKSRNEQAHDAYYQGIGRFFSENGVEIVDRRWFDSAKGDWILENTGRQVTSNFLRHIELCSYTVADGLPDNILKRDIELTVGPEGIINPDPKILLPVNKVIARNIDLKEELEELVETCILDETVKNLYAPIFKLNEDHDAVSNKLIEGLEQILNDLEYAHKPLAGSCDRCKFTIGR